MNNKMKPALLGGVVTGILSLIPIVSSCCCLWAIGGGLLASYLYIKDSAAPVPIGEGVVMGAMSGGVASVIYLIIGLPLMLIMGGIANMEAMYRQAGIEMPVAGMALALLSVLIMVVGLLIFSTIGGVLGVAIFEKRKGGPGAPPAPPHDFGGAQPGGFGSGL